MSAKFTVAELAKMMGKPAKEVLFLLQGIGVDVKTAESVLDPATAQALLMGKTQAPKSLIVRQAPVGRGRGCRRERLGGEGAHRARRVEAHQDRRALPRRRRGRGRSRP